MSYEICSGKWIDVHQLNLIIMGNKNNNKHNQTTKQQKKTPNEWTNIAKLFVLMCISHAIAMLINFVFVIFTWNALFILSRYHRINPLFLFRMSLTLFFSGFNFKVLKYCRMWWNISSWLFCDNLTIKLKCQPNHICVSINRLSHFNVSQRPKNHRLDKCKNVNYEKGGEKKAHTHNRITKRNLN